MVLECLAVHLVSILRLRLRVRAMGLRVFVHCGWMSLGYVFVRAGYSAKLDNDAPDNLCHFSTPKKDKIRILSGFLEGKTTERSDGLLIENTDARSSDYQTIKPISSGSR